MTIKASTILRNLKPWGETGTRDLAVIDGKFAAVAPGMTADHTIDAAGRLAVPGFIEPHIHLDKVLIVDTVRPNVSGTLTEAIEIIWERKRRYEVDEIAARAGRVIEAAIAHGVTHIRTHVDVDCARPRSLSEIGQSALGRLGKSRTIFCDCRPINAADFG